MITIMENGLSFISIYIKHKKEQKEIRTLLKMFAREFSRSIAWLSIRKELIDLLLGLFAAVTSKVIVESIIGGVTLGTTIYCCSKTGKTSKGKKYK